MLILGRGVKFQSHLTLKNEVGLGGGIEAEEIESKSAGTTTYYY